MGIKTFIRNINYLRKNSLWDQREHDIVYLTDKILEDTAYEYGLSRVDGWGVKILNQEETLDLFEKEPKSFIRTGDGEIKLMMGQDQPFQKYEKEIADSLKQSLAVQRDDIYVGINRNYFIPLATQEDSSYYRRYAFEFRNFYKRVLNKNYTYIDATVTSCPIGIKRNEKYDQIFNRWKKLFANRNVIVVSGEGILNDFQYDIFELAQSKIVIDAPRVNAWDKKEYIVSNIRKYDCSSVLVVFILGMAGKALIPRLTDEGYMCWDVGHLAKYYDTYMSEREMTNNEKKRFYAPD